MKGQIQVIVLLFVIYSAICPIFVYIAQKQETMDTLYRSYRKVFRLNLILPSWRPCLI